MLFPWCHFRPVAGKADDPLGGRRPRTPLGVNLRLANNAIGDARCPWHQRSATTVTSHELLHGTCMLPHIFKRVSREIPGLRLLDIHSTVIALIELAANLWRMRKALLCLFLGGRSLFAQFEYAEVLGTARDVSDAVVIGARVVLRNLDTNCSHTLRSRG
jgi:hypothetical protein